MCKIESTGALIAGSRALVFLEPELLCILHPHAPLLVHQKAVSISKDAFVIIDLYYTIRAGLVWENGTVTGSTFASTVTRSGLPAGCIPFSFLKFSFSLQAASSPLLVLTSHLHSSAKGVPALPGPADHLLAR